MIKGFDDYINESWDGIDPNVEKNVAGVAIVWNDSILLVHPTNATWRKSGALGIPKGGIEPGEDPLDAAIREVKEETGIDVELSKLDLEPHTAPHYKKDGTIKSQLIYFILRIENPTEIGIYSHKVPKEQLQLEEIDWAGFVKIQDAYPLMHSSQLIILDRIK